MTEMFAHVLILLLSVQYTCSGVINNAGRMEFIYRIPEQWAEQHWRREAPKPKPKEVHKVVKTVATPSETARSIVPVNTVTPSISNEIDEDNDASCIYEGRYYKPGETHVTDCVTCQCRHDGVMSCTVTTCPKQDDCIRYEPVPGKCCPECVEWGCYHEGVAYPRGARIPTPSCQVCFCPWDGGTSGKARCSRVTCPPSKCVDGKVPNGKCCPVCPHGPNCWMGDLVIPFGQDVWIAPCRSCACPPLNVTAHAGLKAVCKWHTTCSFG